MICYGTKLIHQPNCSGKISIFSSLVFVFLMLFHSRKLQRTYWKLDIQEMTLDMKIHFNQSILTSPSTGKQHVYSQQPLLTNSFDSVHSSLPPSFATLLTSCSTENLKEAPETMETEFVSQIIGYGPRRRSTQQRHLCSTS